MRNEICRALCALARKAEFAFLTGDLGFMALEPLRDALGSRFINAGIAEQNMVSMAAGLVHSGLPAWVYSIAPFCYARAFEQIRNDVCLNRLPVKLIGNGGGYAYGCMGATHHALEDYGVLQGLPGMRVYVPAFRADVAPCVERMMALTQPSYLRLGRCELPAGWALPPYAPWRRLLDGEGALLAVTGPLAGPLLAAVAALPSGIRPEVWVASELPLSMETLPAAFLDRLARSEVLCVVEEHVAAGGVAQSLACLLLQHGLAPRRLLHACARGYPSGRYGSQAFHRAENALDAASVLALLGLEAAQPCATI